MWTVAYQAPPSMGFSRQEYGSGLPFPSPMNLIANANQESKIDTQPHKRERNTNIIQRQSSNCKRRELRDKNGTKKEQEKQQENN